MQNLEEDDILFSLSDEWTGKVHYPDHDEPLATLNDVEEMSQDRDEEGSFLLLVYSNKQQFKIRVEEC